MKKSIELIIKSIKSRIYKNLDMKKFLITEYFKS